MLEKWNAKCLSHELWLLLLFPGVCLFVFCAMNFWIFVARLRRGPARASLFKDFVEKVFNPGDTAGNLDMLVALKVISC